jgi:hypothetical protein
MINGNLFSCSEKEEAESGSEYSIARPNGTIDVLVPFTAAIGKLMTVLRAARITCQFNRLCIVCKKKQDPREAYSKLGRRWAL